MFKNVFKRKIKLNLDSIKQFKLQNCYDCGIEIDKDFCWQRFVEIDGNQYRVGICDECCNKISRTCAFEDIDMKYYYGWYIKELVKKINDFEHIDNRMTIEEFIKYLNLRIDNQEKE